MRRGQISLEFVIIGVAGLLLAAGAMVWTQYYGATESQKGVERQLRDIAQHIGDAAERQALYSQSDCLSVDAPMISDANKSNLQTCKIKFVKGNGTNPDRIDLNYPEPLPAGQVPLTYSIILKTPNLNGFPDSTRLFANCGQTVFLKGACS